MAIDVLKSGEGFMIDPRVVAHRVGHFVHGIITQPNLGDRLSSADTLRQHYEDVAVGRLLGLTVLGRRVGQPMHMYDRNGRVVGNLWEEFNALPRDVGFPDMGFDDDQIAALEEKAELERS